MSSDENIEEIARRYRLESDEEKRNIENNIIEICTPLVHKIANKYRMAVTSDASDIQDNIQNGFQGLLTAIRSYDAKCGAKFLTYAFSCIRKAVYTGVREINTAGKSKALTNSRLQKYKKKKAELQKQLGRNPTVKEISIETGWKISTVLAYERQIQPVHSLDLESVDFFL